MMNAVYDKKVILLIDEYDVPLAKASEKDTAKNGYYSRMLEVADRKEAGKEIKDCYDGYVFGNSYVYCPWDVINHISALRYKRTTKPKNYWKNTSHNGILLTFVERTDFDVAEGTPGYEQILCYGVAFYQKQAKVKILKK